jgi:GMP synthase (glutamine-hydrolysing)
MHLPDDATAAARARTAYWRVPFRGDARVKTLVALRHLAFEDLGLLAPLLAGLGWRIRYHDVGVDPLDGLDLGQVDLLAVLGGPIGAEDDDAYPFLRDEVQLVRERLATQRPMLGICLGAQLVARAMGARVQPMGAKEIGYAPVSLTGDGQRSPLAAIGTQPVLHWHGDQFAMPQGVASLASTAACPHQAFCIGQHVMAWQFHLEVDAARIEQWLIGHAGELAQARVAPQRIREDARLHDVALQRTLAAVMQPWLAALPV